MGTGTLTLGGFGRIALTAAAEMDFSGSGAVNAGAANVVLTAPALVALASSDQALTTTGTLTIASNGAAPTIGASEISGSLALTGGSLSDSGTLDALSGTLKLTATSGDVTLGSDARIDAAGTAIDLGSSGTEDTSGGIVELVSDTGNVTLEAGSIVTVAAAGGGYAGTLDIGAAGTATLAGTLQGAAAYNDIGGSLYLVAGSLSGALPISSGFTGTFEVELGRGDITISAGETLTSKNVLLVANEGAIDIEGTIDASGPSGGTIALYGSGTSTAAAGSAGASGVTIGSGAQLLARYEI